MSPLLAFVGLFGGLVFCLISGLPISFVLAGISIFTILFLCGPAGLFMVAHNAWAAFSDYILLAVPGFILMGNLLESSKVADDLYGMMYKWLGFIPGGLAMGTVLVCAIFAAMTGITGAATVTMGLIAIPSMLRRSYDKRMITGVVSAGGCPWHSYSPKYYRYPLWLFNWCFCREVVHGGT